MRGEVDFFPTDKQKGFLEDDNVTLGLHRQAFPRYPNKQVCNIFAIFQGKHERGSWFFDFR